MSALVRHVSVRDDLGNVHSFGPGDEVPEWAVRKITNPLAWEDGEVPFPSKRPKGGGAKPDAPAVGGVSETSVQESEDRIVERVLAGVADLLNGLIVGDDDATEDSDDVEGTGDGPPPRQGKGSGEEKWRAYAAEKGVDVTDLDGRDEIIARLKDRDIPVE